MGQEVLFFVPNLIGYIRLCLLMVSLYLYDQPSSFILVYGLSASLDAVDGILARKLNQTSAFGAWLDVVVDLITRGALWCFISKWGYFVMVIEWTAFVSTHCRGADWKIPENEFPLICKMVMAKGFKTPTGAYAITGIFVLPIWIYCMTSGFMTQILHLPIVIQQCVLITLIVGRLLGLVVELFFIQQHIKGLLRDHGATKTS
ncbi:hypothetical protein ACF0H5_016555 [Mactra antiquata]